VVLSEFCLQSGGLIEIIRCKSGPAFEQGLNVSEQAFDKDLANQRLYEVRGCRHSPGATNIKKRSCVSTWGATQLMRMILMFAQQRSKTKMHVAVAHADTLVNRLDLICPVDDKCKKQTD